MARYKYLLWDIDGTVLNFLSAEKAAMQTLFIKYDFGKCTDEMVKLYSKINTKYWEALERGEMSKKEILVGRFAEFFQTIGLDTSLAEQFNKDYQLALGDTIVFYDHADQILASLKNKYVLVAVTNGTKEAQNKKLNESGLIKVFDYYFISELVGIEKPNKGFFDFVFSKLQIKDLDETLIIGDSLTSDILGGIYAGIDTCWFNPRHETNTKGYTPTYEIDNLNEIYKII